MVHGTTGDISPETGSTDKSTGVAFYLGAANVWITNLQNDILAVKGFSRRRPGASPSKPD